MCPNLALLRAYKVYPRKVDFQYSRDRFFIYVYLEPFKELNNPLKVQIKSKEYCFAYLPIYIGKGTGAGYRHNQHVSSFLNQKENNIFKEAAFKHISEEMAQAAAKNLRDKPWNWKEYQNQYIIILETFDNPKQLIDFEIELIKKIGTVFDKTGPLTNKIKNVQKYDFVLRTGNGQLM